MTTTKTKTTTTNKSEPRVTVLPTPLGQGLFAARPFRADEVIGELTGTVICDPNYAGSSYAIELSPELTLEPEAPFRFLNHSCQPNSRLVVDRRRGGSGKATAPRAWVEANVAIRQGEELTIDYAWSAEDAIPCGCGSSNCRGWIVAVAELNELTSRKKAK